MLNHFLVDWFNQRCFQLSDCNVVLHMDCSMSLQTVDRLHRHLCNTEEQAASLLLLSESSAYLELVFSLT